MFSSERYPNKTNLTIIPKLEKEDETYQTFLAYYFMQFIDLHKQ
jgi:hypothetical protein